MLSFDEALAQLQKYFVVPAGRSAVAFGEALEWQRLDGKRACRVKAEVSANVFDKDQWREMISFMTDRMIRLERTFGQPLQNAAQGLNL